MSCSRSAAASTTAPPARGSRYTLTIRHKLIQIDNDPAESTHYPVTSASSATPRSLEVMTARTGELKSAKTFEDWVARCATAVRVDRYQAPFAESDQSPLLPSV